MRIHDRYVLGLHLKILILCAVGFTVIFVLIDVFEKLDSFIDNEATTRDATEFFLFKIPEMVRLTLPVDVLLATMLTLGVLGRNNEIVALVASGVSLLRIAAPIVMVSFALVAGSLVLSEWVVPRTNKQMLHIKRVRIEKKPPLDRPVRHNFSYYGRGGYLCIARIFNTRKSELTDVVLSFYDQGRVVTRIDARRAEWRETLWRFHDGYLRRFDDTGEHAESFREMNVPEFLESPDELARLDPQPAAMNFSELRAYVERVSASGADVRKYLVDVHAKISYPFTILIMALLGIGISATKKRSSLAAGFAQTLIIAFGYLVVVEITEAFGKNNTVAPWISAWSAPAVFAVASMVVLRRANR